MKRALEVSAVAIGFAAALYPLLQWYLLRMDDGGDEPLGLIALATAALLSWKGRGQLSASPRAALLMLAVYGLTSWLALPPMIRAVPALAAIAAWFGLWRRPPVLALLLLSLPVIASLQFYVGYPLRLFATHCAGMLLELSGIPITISGVELLHHGTAVGVDPPCSGVRMLWVSCFLAAAFAGRTALGWWHTAILGTLAILLAVFANALRATVLFFPEAGLVSWPHWTHEATGIAFFTVASTALLISANRLQR